MKHKGFGRLWINALKEDFPEYIEAIDRLDTKIDLHFELIEDYYFCRQKIKMLEKSRNTELLEEFTVVFEDLKEDIRQILKRA